MRASVLDEPDPEVLRGVGAAQQQRGVARHLGVGVGRERLDAYAAARRPRPAAGRAARGPPGPRRRRRGPAAAAGRSADSSANGSSNTSRGRVASITGSRCSASPARAVRPLARRIDSATRRAARAASTEPPHTTGLVSASAMASILAGLTARSRWGEQRSRRRRAPRPPRSASARGPRSTLVEVVQHHHRGGQLVAGHGRQHRAPAAGRVLGDQRSLGGQATTTWQPRRTASATADAEPRSEPSGASTTTRSRLPAQPGSAGLGQATNGTGHHGSSTARSSRESGPAAITARGRASSRSRATASAVRLGGLARPRGAPARRSRPGRAGAASIDCEHAARRRAGTRRTRWPSSASSVRLAGLVDQQHRDVVAHRVGQSAALAHELVAPSCDSAGSSPWQAGQTMMLSSCAVDVHAGILGEITGGSVGRCEHPQVPPLRPARRIVGGVQRDRCAAPGGRPRGRRRPAPAGRRCWARAVGSGARRRTSQPRGAESRSLCSSHRS